MKWLWVSHTTPYTTLHRSPYTSLHDPTRSILSTDHASGWEAFSSASLTWFFIFMGISIVASIEGQPQVRASIRRRNLPCLGYSRPTNTLDD